MDERELKIVKKLCAPRDNLKEMRLKILYAGGWISNKEYLKLKGAVKNVRSN